MSSKQGLDCGKLGGKYGKRGGRPSSKGKLLGMATLEYEIVAFLNSQSIKSTKFCFSIRFMKKYKNLFRYKVYDFLHFSSTENFQFFSKKRPLLEWGFVKRSVLEWDFEIFLVSKMEETL